MSRYFVLVFYFCTLWSAGAQEFWFWPDYTLGQRANNYPGNRIASPTPLKESIVVETLPVLFQGEEPTARVVNFAEVSDLSPERFSVELWTVNHVNRPVGVLATLRSKLVARESAWLLGIYNRSITAALGSDPLISIEHQIGARRRGEYWNHVVITFDGDSLRLMLNGELLAKRHVPERPKVQLDNFQLEVAGYMKNEPYMDIGNMLKMLRVESRAISIAEVGKRYSDLQKLVLEGKLFPDLFHFTAGPYLNNVTGSSISLVWETDRPSDFVVEYGKQVPLTSRVELNTQSLVPEQKPGSSIYSVTLENLDAESAYFYNIMAKAHDGEVMDSGLLTFSTAVQEQSSYMFAVIGDTEARPHINDRVAKLVWDERPNFILNVGDLTDGGQKDHKFEWNYEYFQGITQLTSRVPAFPVPGNGESDLYWYNQYHNVPDRGYYSFGFGNAEFFMLNSNLPEDFAPGGKQYKWLENELQNSKAEWKFVAHHHAPYSADEDDYGDSWSGTFDLGDPKVREIVPLYEKYGVNMVFFGHLHTYQRTMPIKENKVNTKEGVIYVQGGGGGGNLEDFAPGRAWFSAKTYRGHHYFTIAIHGKHLNFKMYDTEGRLKDYFDIDSSGR
ncbi:MAG: metallophosphoesterase [Cytophagales bacterium]